MVGGSAGPDNGGPVSDAAAKRSSPERFGAASLTHAPASPEAFLIVPGVPSAAQPLIIAANAAPRPLTGADAPERTDDPHRRRPAAPVRVAVRRLCHAPRAGNRGRTQDPPQPRTRLAGRGVRGG